MLDQIIIIVVSLIVIGIIVWAVKALPNIDATFKQYALILIYVVSAIWFLYKLVPILRSAIR